ncbi:MAG: LysR substrate-binding domain-containing protein [Nevskiaceae bacterium]
MTLTELRYLVNLDTERHFGRAAERSFVAQPTLSVAVKKLEDQLGVVLFERNRGEARPTPVGEHIIAQARRVLAEAALIEDLAQQGRDELTGALRFGAIYTVGPYLLPLLVPLLRRRAPQMPLVIEENFTAGLLQQLRANELDVIVVAQPIDTQGLQTWALYDEPFVALLPPDHRWSGEGAIPARKLAEEKLLLLGPGHCFREQVIEACPKCVDPDRDGPRPHTGSSLETIRHMVASGLGITVVPRSSVENRPDEPALLVSRPLARPAPGRRVILAWRKTFPRMKAVAALRAAILECGMKGVQFIAQAQPEAGI